MFLRKLQALTYPRWREPILKSEKELRTLVVWLEETKIRFYEVKRRENLRKVDSPQWNTFFEEYLKDLGCPRDFSSNMNESQLMAVVEWLLGQAVSAEYNDQAAKYNKVDKSEYVKQENNPKQSPAEVQQVAPVKLPTAQQSVLDCSGADFLEAVNHIAKLLKLPEAADQSQAAALLKEVKQRMERSVSRIAEKKDSKSKRKDVEEQKVAVENFALGFKTGDPAVDKAATILRLLHLHDLRELQTLINEVIVAVQEHTADPKTDSRLGQVGRG